MRKTKYNAPRTKDTVRQTFLFDFVQALALLFDFVCEGDLVGVFYTREHMLDVRKKFIELVTEEGWSPMYAMGLCGVKENTFRNYFKNDEPIKKIMQDAKEKRRLVKRGPS